jgi:hypothetical protein
MNKTIKSDQIRSTLALAAVLITSAFSSHAQNSLTATATLSDVPSGGAFDYTLTLQNTGSVGINALWYGWIQGVFNLPVAGSSLQNVQNSLNWTPIDSGNSVQFENLSGSALAAGASMTFTFSSTAAPGSFITDTLSRSVASVAYASASGPSTFGQSMNGVASDPIPTALVPAPEPSSMALAVGGFVLAFAGWKKARKNITTAKNPVVVK